MDFYTPLRETLPPLEYDVTIPNRLTGALHRVHVKARHLLYREFAGLEDLLIGEVQSIADPTGIQPMRGKRLKLKSVVSELSNLNPDVYPGGVISRKEEVEKWIESSENDDAVWAAWIVYERLIDNPPTKSEAEGGGAGGGAGEGSAQETRPNSHLRSVRGSDPDGEGDGGAVRVGNGNGAVPHAGESGSEEEAFEGVAV